MKMLGFDNIIENIKNAIGDKILKDLENIASFNTDMQKIFESLDAGMQKFSPISNSNLGDSLKSMLGELFEAQIDPNRPAVIPDWPELKIDDNIKRMTGLVKRYARIDWDNRLLTNFSETYSEISAFNVTELFELHDPLCVEIANKAKNITQLLKRG